MYFNPTNPTQSGEDFDNEVNAAEQRIQAAKDAYAAKKREVDASWSWMSESKRAVAQAELARLAGEVTNAYAQAAIRMNTFWISALEAQDDAARAERAKALRDHWESQASGWTQTSDGHSTSSAESKAKAKAALTPWDPSKVRPDLRGPGRLRRPTTGPSTPTTGPGPTPTAPAAPTGPAGPTGGAPPAGPTPVPSPPTPPGVPAAPTPAQAPTPPSQPPAPAPTPTGYPLGARPLHPGEEGPEPEF